MPLSNLVAIAIAAALYLKAPKHGRPWLIAAGVIAVQTLCFETIGRSRAWETAFAAIGSVPAPAVAGLGLAASAVAIWAGWTAGQSPPRALAPA